VWPALLLCRLLAQALEIEQCFNECLAMASQMEQEMDTEPARYVSQPLRPHPVYSSTNSSVSGEWQHFCFRNYTFVMLF